ncbi:MAG: hypothetical protein RBS57_05910, partial [Desulforhabdus sp.]|nr:hypothetical protein [Desulforhabdus sp.]
PEEEEIIELEDILELEEETDDSDVKPVASELEQSELSELDLKDLELELDPDEESFLEGDLPSELSFEDEEADDDSLEFDLKAIESEKPVEEADISEELEEIALTSVETESPPAAAAPVESAVAEPEDAAEVQSGKPSLDDFVAQIEDRLLEAVHQIVESRLPDIVRTILREEIDRLQLDSEKEKA